MIRPITYDKQIIKARDHALVVSQFYAGRMGVLEGCGITHDTQNIYIAPGYFFTSGRLTRIEATETVFVPLPPSGIRYCLLVWDIDLSQVPEVNNTPQVSWKILQDASAYPPPIQEDLFANPTSGRYQQIWARFETDIAGIMPDSFQTVIQDVGTPEDVLAGYEEEIELSVSGWQKVDIEANPEFKDHPSEYVNFWPPLTQDPIGRITPFTTATARLTYADVTAGLPEPNDGITMDGRVAFFLTAPAEFTLHLTIRLENGYMRGGLING